MLLPQKLLLLLYSKLTPLHKPMPNQQNDNFSTNSNYTGIDNDCVHQSRPKQNLCTLIGHVLVV